MKIKKTFQMTLSKKNSDGVITVFTFGTEMEEDEDNAEGEELAGWVYESTMHDLAVATEKNPAVKGVFEAMKKSFKTEEKASKINFEDY